MKFRVKNRCAKCGKVIVMRDGRREIECDHCGHVNCIEIKKNGKLKVR